MGLERLSSAPYLVLDRTKGYSTPHHDSEFPRQLRQGGDGRHDGQHHPDHYSIVIVYLAGQKHIIKGRGRRRVEGIKTLQPAAALRPAGRGRFPAYPGP